MADPVAYFALQDLIDVMSEETFMAVFDDQGSGSLDTVKASTQVATVVRNAHAFVRSWLGPVYGSSLPADNTTPTTMSDLVRCASLEVAQCYAYRRRPEFVKTYGAFPGGPMWKGAIEMLERIQAGTQRIPANDHPPVDPPPNVGGELGEDGNKAFVNTSTAADNPTQGDF